MELIKKFLENHLVAIPSVLILTFAVGGFAYLQSTKKPADNYFTLEPIHLVEKIDVSGKVKAAESVDLAFEHSGTISSVNVSVGSHVGVGQILASLSSSDLIAQRDGAQANLNGMQARLDQLMHGARPEEIALAQNNLDTANIAEVQSRKVAMDTMETAYSAADASVHTTADALFINPRSLNPQVIFLTTDNQNLVNLLAMRIKIEAEFSQWKNAFSSLSGSTDSASLQVSLQDTSNKLNDVISFLDILKSALQNAIPTNSFSSSVISANLAAIQSARLSLQGSVTAIIGAEGSLQQSSLAAIQAQEALSLKQNGGTIDDINAAKASLDAATAAVLGLNVQIDKTVLRSPFNGTVTVNDAKVGQIASPNAPLVSLISDAKFEIECYVAETDVSKIKVGQSAEVTLDAYSANSQSAFSTGFLASIVAIDPSDTVVNGISSYKVTLQFNDNNSLIKSGMTADVHIVTAEKNNVLAVPRQAVITHADGQYVLTLRQGDKAGNTTPQLILVQTGIEDTTSAKTDMIEITSGLSAGDKIVGF
jgi:HlyD family secretion protein